MRRAWRSLISRLLVAVLVSLAVFAAASPFMATPAFGAISTNFSPTTVTLPAGSSTTVTIVGTGLAAGDTAAHFDVRHNTTNTVISSPACIGLFAGANPNQATTAGQGDLLQCTFAAGGASGTTGNVMTFILTANGADTLTFNMATTFYLTASFALDPAGTLNILTVTIGTPVTPMPTFTFTATPVATGVVTATATTTATPTPTPVGILGDFNRDGFVDIRDYGVWRQNFGQTNCGNPADANGDCLVDIRDYGIWRVQFGEGTPPAAPRSTPGPALPRSDRPAERSWPLLGAEAPSRAVPVAPETDGISLLGGAARARGLAGWQARRPPTTRE